ncbi:MAG: putative toxin-antitoxin system toxin component, PIN family [Chloroflexi bacterium]|nr:putative toxin-antitoxin system toxin component, PIN family [Chloroflexota bacterium]
MKVVVDTNVLVSAALRDKEPQAVIECIVARSDLEWIISPEIMIEYKEVLARLKFGFTEPILRQWNDLLDASTTTVEVGIVLNFPRDRKDAKFLACALAADADFFVTGDKDFTQAEKLVHTTILPVSLFKKLVCDISE